MVIRNIKNFIKKIHMPKTLYKEYLNNLDKLKEILNIKNSNLYKLVTSNLRLRYLSKKIRINPKTIETIISLSIYKNDRHLLKLIDKSILFSKKEITFTR